MWEIFFQGCMLSIAGNVLINVDVFIVNVIIVSCVFYKKEVHNVITFCHNVCNAIDLCHNARGVAKLHDNTTWTCNVNKHKQCIWKL